MPITLNKVPALPNKQPECPPEALPISVAPTPRTNSPNPATITTCQESQSPITQSEPHKLQCHPLTRISYICITKSHKIQAILSCSSLVFATLKGNNGVT
ncbi:hypothetical protein S83_035896 [Arachis hypogaea]|nr:uncharacterized protein DS421_11g338200 [Arachis hypogaea]